MIVTQARRDSCRHLPPSIMMPTMRACGGCPGPLSSQTQQKPQLCHKSAPPHPRSQICNPFLPLDPNREDGSHSCPPLAPAINNVGPRMQQQRQQLHTEFGVLRVSLHTRSGCGLSGELGQSPWFTRHHVGRASNARRGGRIRCAMQR